MSDDPIKIGLTAGLPKNLKNILGKDAQVIAFDSFGFSAPAGVLDNKLGYTAENVYSQVSQLINKEKFEA